MKNAEKYQALSTIGIQVLCQEQSCAEFVGAMYAYGKTNCISRNKLRAEKSSKGMHAKKLPPKE